MQKEKVRIGVLGCANIARTSLIPAIKELNSKFDLKYVASRSKSKADEFAGLFDCKAKYSYEELVNSKDVDALYIPLPTGLHKEWITKALNAGKHVYAEKSFANSFEDANEMISNAKSRKLGIMEGYMFLYHTQHKLVFDLIKKGKIGAIRHFSSKFGFPALRKDNFRYDDQLGGGALLDAAGYTVKSVHFILGNNFEVKSATLYHDKNIGTNIFGSAFLTDSSGVGASISFGFDNFYQCRYEIWGENGKITAERAFTPSPTFIPLIIVETNNGKEIIEAQADNHFVHAMEEFYTIIQNEDSRKNHYSQILLQSHSLELIRKYST